jgi:hypothetical protein
MKSSTTIIGAAARARVAPSTEEHSAGADLPLDPNA